MAGRLTKPPAAGALCQRRQAARFPGRERVVEIAGPAIGHRRKRDAETEEDIPACHPGGQFAEQRIGIAVGGAATADACRQLRIGKGDESAGNPCRDKGR